MAKGNRFSKRALARAKRDSRYKNTINNSMMFFEHCSHKNKNSLHGLKLSENSLNAPNADVYLDDAKTPICFVPFPGSEDVRFKIDESSSSSSKRSRPSLSSSPVQSKRSKPSLSSSSSANVIDLTLSDDDDDVKDTPSTPPPPNSLIVRPDDEIVFDDASDDAFDRNLTGFPTNTDEPYDYYGRYDRTVFEPDVNKTFYEGSNIGTWRHLQNTNRKMKGYCNCISTKFFRLAGDLDNDRNGREILRCMKKLRKAGKPGSRSHDAYLKDCRKVGDPFHQCQEELGYEYKDFQGIESGDKTRRCVWGMQKFDGVKEPAMPRGVMMYLDSRDQIGVKTNKNNGRDYLDLYGIREIADFKDYKRNEFRGIDKRKAYHYLKKLDRNLTIPYTPMEGSDLATERAWDAFDHVLRHYEQQEQQGDLRRQVEDLPYAVIGNPGEPTVHLEILVNLASEFPCYKYVSNRFNHGVYQLEDTESQHRKTGECKPLD
eukprot:jgi/Bigna1/69835/fgenesh1_pg.10_\